MRLRNTNNIPGSRLSNSLLYADDQVVFINSSDELQILQILTIYDKILKRFGLQMSYNKTETMVFNTDTALMVQESIVSLSKEKITNVRKYKYLLNTLTQITTCHSFMKELVLPSKNGMN